MPVSIRNSPFNNNNKTTAKKRPLKVPQARVLAALMPENIELPVSEWPLLTRANLGVNAGYTAISGTITRALSGIKETNKSSGEPHLGLIGLGYVEELVMDVEGVKEINYRATTTGAMAYLEWSIMKGGKIPQLKDKKLCTNDRYKKDTKQ